MLHRRARARHAHERQPKAVSLSPRGGRDTSCRELATCHVAAMAAAIRPGRIRCLGHVALSGRHRIADGDDQEVLDGHGLLLIARPGTQSDLMLALAADVDRSRAPPVRTRAQQHMPAGAVDAPLRPLGVAAKGGGAGDPDWVEVERPREV